jgi:hypothetical protein
MLRGRRLGPLGFWDDFKDEIESAHQSLIAGGGTAYQLFAKGWFGLAYQSYSEGPNRLGNHNMHFGSPFGIPMHELEKPLSGPMPHFVTFTAHRFLEEIIHQIKNAADWKTLDRIARPLIGQYSLHAGILYGIGESLVGDVVGLLGLAKLVALAGLYERIKHPMLMSFSDPMTLTLTIAVRHIGWLNREAKAADEQLWNTLKELKEIAKHPGTFIEIIGQHTWKGVVKDWNDLKSYAFNPSVTHDFQAGRIMGRALYQVIMMILLVMSVAGVAVKLAARFPWLMRLARIISRGGKLEELEDIRQGVGAVREAENVPRPKAEPRPKPEPEPEVQPPANRSKWRTEPTGTRGGKSTGERTVNTANADAAGKRSVELENKAADILANAGYKVEQNPTVPGLKRPDYRIEGEIFDCYSPNTSDPRSIVDMINKKVVRGQADRIVLNLEDSGITRNELRQAITDYGAKDLKEVIVIDQNGNVVRFYP